MKKIMMIVLMVTLLTFTACEKQDQVKQSNSNSTIESNENSMEENNEETLSLGYSLDTVEYSDEENSILIKYPKIEGFNGELLMNYMNQSLSRVKDTYSDVENYNNVDIDYKVMYQGNDKLSVVYTGAADLISIGRQINVMNSITLDLKTSNEITYDNLVDDKEAIEKLLDSKAKDIGIEEGFVAEGVRVYYTNESVVFYYMPLDDSAKEFIELPLLIKDIAEYINSDFGDTPAS